MLLCLPPFTYTPKQVRTDFTLRDFDLISMAWNSREDLSGDT